MKAKEPRTVKGYKIQDSTYQKAMRRAKREKLELATLVEVWVIAYAHKDDFLISGQPPTQFPIQL